MAGGEKKRVSEIERERASRAVTEQQAKASSQGVDATNSSNQEAGENEKNPAISNPRWEDTKGQAITKALVGDEVYLCAHVTDIADGATATIKIVEKDANGKDVPVATLSAVVSGGRIKCRWKVKYTADDDDADSQKELKEKGYTLPEYAFVVECVGTTSGESGVLEVYADFIAKLSMNGKLLRNYPYILKLADGSCRKGQTNSEGYIIENELPVGKVKIL